MNILNAIKCFNAIPPGAIKDNAAFTSNVLDKAELIPQDAKGVLFLVQLGATDIAMAALKVMQSDTLTNGTTLGGSPAEVHDVVTKPGEDDDNGLFAIYVPIAKWTERYLQLQASAGNGSAGTYLSALAIVDLPGASGPVAELLGVNSVEIV